MGAVNIVFKSYHLPEVLDRGYWDQAILQSTFDKMDCNYYPDVDEIPQGEGQDWQGAVVVINGRTHIDDTDNINTDISKLRWVVLIITGDEESSFDWRKIQHPIMRIWVQLPRMNEHNDTSYKLPNGYRPTTRQVLKEIGQQERTNDWMFAGQVNHDRREQCVEAAKSLEQPGVLVETHNFGEEKMPYKDYLHTMARTKIVLCPSGIESPDNFRLYEALEAGCLPIVDAFSHKHKAPGFWQYLFGDGIPFPIIPYWSDLPKLMPTLLKEYPSNAIKCSAWWMQRKRSMYYKLIDDIRILNG